MEAVFIHPDYDEPDRANDIALIKLTDPAEFNDIVSPICLPDQDDFGDSSSFGVGMNCYLSGEFLYFKSLHDLSHLTKFKLQF